MEFEHLQKFVASVPSSFESSYHLHRVVCNMSSSRSFKAVRVFAPMLQGIGLISWSLSL